jgi:hypothetical protein
MIRKFIFSLLILGFIQGSVKAQESRALSLEVNSLLDVGKKYYGLQIQLEKELLEGATGRYDLSIGLSNEFHVVNEKDLEEVSGNTLFNQLGLVVSNRLHLLRNRRLYLSNSAYLAWSYRRTQANFFDPVHQIDRDTYSERHFLGIGIYWKLGYEFRENWSVQVVTKTDLSRLIDKYSFELARPGILYGLGIRTEF